MNTIEELRLAVVGLGYVGLPLAAEFGKHRFVIGYDQNARRIRELVGGVDRTREITESELKAAKYLKLSSNPNDLTEANCFIVSVPTPIDEHKRPDLRPLLSASELVGGALRVGGIVIYESTVYPGATEEVCVPILEMVSGLKFNQDFFVGYSPERINPGDQAHRLRSICKVTSGSTPEAALLIDQLYREIIDEGTHRAPSIKVAEAAKVIENTQRDINIALMNELSMIFSKIGIDTESVLAAARTKWNFMPFVPGLVGGHCIGVDPYYLTHKAEAMGYHPQIILAGRRLNDSMGEYVADRLIKEMLRRGINVVGAKVLILGLAFKENCPDIRNTRVVDVISELNAFNCIVDVYDPWVSSEDAMNEYGIDLVEYPKRGSYDAIVIAVAHREFRELGSKIRNLGADTHVVYDLKFVLAENQADIRL